MPTHPDVERIQRYVHGELDALAAAALDGHFEDCPSCRARVDDARQEERRIDALLWQLDHRVPAIAVADVVRRAAGRPRMLRWAAGILFAGVTAGAAYALPGSPLRSWLDRSEAATGSAPTPMSLPAATADTSSAAGGGMFLDPADAQIVLRAVGPGSRVTILLVPATTVEIRTLRGRPAFDQELDRLVIDGRGDVVDFTIRVPHDAARVAIRIGDRLIFDKRGTAVESTVQPEAGEYVIRVDSIP